ncbi:NOTUM-like protein [Mya arenaria]|uniref:NOTUM-like protein n=1 Tax=Mya arenaria TaxID=6604 RepID=A0ABY7EJ25_MYAAR|nr:NOTUM-like protein [Mya arenaria]
MPFCVSLLWIHAACVTVVMVSSYSINDHRSSNDINLDFDKLERLGQTDSLIKALKQIAQNSHDCGVRDVPKLRRKFLTNDSITCNDGSPAGYFIRKSYGSKKWIIFLEVTGMLSWNPEENPYYFHSNIVYIPYCSSDTWSGTAPKGTNGNEYAFMGSLILEQVIKDLIPRGLKHATKLILTGSRMWQGRVPEACQAEYPESEHWRCYFGYRIYKNIKTPLYVIQHLFDEAQILVDNVFEQTQIRGDQSAAMVSRSQWQYLHKLGQEVRNTLQNVSAVFAPACLSHEVLLRPDWFNISINGIKLGQSIYCWENSYKYDKCIRSTTSVNAIEPLNETLQGDSPKANTTSKKDRRRHKRKKDRKRRRRKNKKKKLRRREKGERKGDNRANRRQRESKEKNKNRRRRHQYPSGSCFHHLIDSCPLPQCNESCPKYRNRYTGDEMDFLRMFIQYGLDRKEIAELLGQDMSAVEHMDDNAVRRLIMKFVNKGS